MRLLANVLLLIKTCGKFKKTFKTRFQRATAYAIARYMLSPVRLSVHHTGGSVKDG